MTRPPAQFSRFFVILIALVLGLSGPALAKKKRGGKRGKTPAAKKVKGGKATSPIDSGSADDSADDSDSDSDSDTAAERESPPPRPKPTPVADDDAESEAPKSARRATPAVSRKAAPEEDAGDEAVPFALQVGVGGSALFRNTVWTDNAGMAASPYKLSPGPQGAVWFEAFPGAFSTTGFGANIGLIGRLNYGFGVSSRDPAGTNLTTKFQSYLVGAKVRFPVGTFIPYVSASYGAQTFDVAGANVPVPGGMSYKFIRPAAGTRIALSPTMDLDLGIGYVLVTDPGSQVKATFPNAKAYGIDIAASFGLRLTDLIGLRAGLDFRQYGITLGNGMNPTTMQPVAVGGGADRYIALWGGLEVVLGGNADGASSSSDEEEEKPAPKKAKKAAAEEDEEESSDDE